MKRRSRRTIAVLTVVFLATVSLISAWVLAGPLSRTRAGAPRTAAPLPEPFASLQFSEEQQQSLRHAEDILVRHCMRARGMDFPVAATADPPPSTPNLYGLLDSTEVARRGYGLHGSSAPSEARLTDRERDALFGTPAHQKTIPLGDGGELAVRTDGCFYKAQTELYGDKWQPLLYGEETLSAEVVARVGRAPRVAVAKKKWAACMRQAGYAVTTLEQVWPDANRRMERAGADRTAGQAAFDALLTQASRDAACQKQSQVASAIGVAQDDAEGSVARGHQQSLRQLAALRNKALATARRLDSGT